ncbi:MAG: Arc family DNA-binding protein [Planctomycetes bacterium]|nr:Arc family DNA-binding protein [Planctomycetota bacterium]
MTEQDTSGRATPPDKERKPFLLRLPPELMEDLRSWAAHDLRSLNGHIEFLLREAVKKRKGKPGG